MYITIRTKLMHLIQYLLILGTTIILISCGAGGSTQLNVTNGACPESIFNAPYCVSAQLINNGGGQNFITSTVFPIGKITLQINGANNILGPTTNSTVYDPNKCTIGATIKPGLQCTFYLQLQGENYAVESLENVNLNVNFTLVSNLFGNNTNVGSANFNLYELTNLYIMQQDGNLTINNAAWTTSGFVANAADPVANAVLVDTTSFGYLYIGGNQGIYPYSITGNILLTPLVLPGGLISAGNMVRDGNGGMYVTNSSLSKSTITSVFNYNFANVTWNPSITNSSTNLPANNVNALSSSSIYLGTNAGGLAIYNCPFNNGSTTTPCSNEPIIGLNGTLNSLAFFTPIKNTTTTGLLAGTTSGLFYESLAGWINEPGPINVKSLIIATESATSYLLAGDAVGRIWGQSSASGTSITTPSVQLLTTLPFGTNITTMIYDTNGQALYIAAMSNNNRPIIYKCRNLGNLTCSTLGISLPTNALVSGLGIGSVLTSNISTPGTFQ